jgi:carboxypeptidase C (cathepsin A)
VKSIFNKTWAIAILALTFPAAQILMAQEQHPTAPATAPAATEETRVVARGSSATETANTPIPAEKPVVTHHELTLGGKLLKYTATAGNLLIRDEEDKPYGSIFYVAYTLDGTDAANRPVTFLYNGGPGSASLWLHLGSVSPVRLVTESPDATPGPPFKLVANEYSLLDQSDLVFIDAPLTGYSRAVGKGTAKDFTGVDEDLKAFDRFIERYLTANQRWNSPKYLFGESYGTLRSASLADVLGNNGVQLNGVILVSSILNYGIRSAGYDTAFIGNLPSYAAAWYFDKIPNKPKELKTWVDEARSFAGGAYATALLKGHNLPADELDTVAKEVSRLTGLSVDYVKESNLRISPTRFRKELLRTERRTMGRYDMRFEGIDMDAAGEAPSYDASDAGISGAFIGKLHDYLQRELKYETTDTYRPSDNTIGQWEWKHKPTTGGPGQGFMDQSQPDAALDLASAMRKNPHLKVFSANGYYDLATPFFATEYDISHMDLDPTQRKNVIFGFYPSGHMIYLNVEALKQLRADLGAFYKSTAN